MRYSIVCVLCLLVCPASVWAQLDRSFNSGSVPRHSPPIPPVGNAFGDRHQCYGPRPAFGVGVGGYYGPSFGYGLGYGYNTFGYSSFGYGAPGFSVGYSTPFVSAAYYGPGWGYPGWGAPVYMAPRPVYVTPPPTPLPDLPQWMIDEAQVGQAVATRATPISRTHRSLIRPSTPEAQLRGVRMQDAGDRLFVKLDYSAAEKSYAKSILAAPDRPDPYVRLALAKAARGDFRGAVGALKQMVDVDATYPARAETLEKLFGHQNGIAKLQLKQNVADWTKIEVRDADRVFLLGVVLFLDGDDRFRTLLDTAVKLEGQQNYLQAFLETVPAHEAEAQPAIAPTPEEIDALTAPPAEEAAPTPEEVPAVFNAPRKSKPLPPPLLLPPANDLPVP